MGDDDLAAGGVSRQLGGDRNGCTASLYKRRWIAPDDSTDVDGDATDAPEPRVANGGGHDVYRADAGSESGPVAKPGATDFRLPMGTGVEQGRRRSRDLGRGGGGQLRDNGGGPREI